MAEELSYASAGGVSNKHKEIAARRLNTADPSKRDRVDKGTGVGGRVGTINTGPTKKIFVPDGRDGLEDIKYLQHLQRQSGAKIKVTRDPNSATRVIELMGASDQIAIAEQLINEMTGLKGSLPKFMIEAKAGSYRSMPSNSADAKYGAPPVKFSSDTKRLQHINSIRNSPVGAQMKRVIDLLLEKRQPFTAEEINDACYVDLNAYKSVKDSLRKNPKVRYDGKTFSYKPTHELNDKSELLFLIRKSPEGIAVVDLKDSYPTVMDDLQSLKASDQIWLLSNFDSQEDIAFPNDPRAVIKVDDDLKQLFRSIELPRDMLDIERDLQKNGMKPATNTAKRRATAQVDGIRTKSKAKKKKHEISKRTKLTNAHLPELFQNLNTSSS